MCFIDIMKLFYKCASNGCGRTNEVSYKEQALSSTQFLTNQGINREPETDWLQYLNVFSWCLQRGTAACSACSVETDLPA